jgi:hypothetical protein
MSNSSFVELYDRKGSFGYFATAACRLIFVITGLSISMHSHIQRKKAIFRWLPVGVDGIEPPTLCL